jgi:uncharacterized OB-fold protein
MSDIRPSPPRRWSAQAARLGTRDAPGELWLPVCQVCGRVDYPLRELCANCLSERLEWKAVEPLGRVLATTTLHRSNLPYFRPQLPLRLASIKLDAGPVVLAFLDAAAVAAEARVRVRTRTDEAGSASLAATPVTDAG